MVDFHCELFDRCINHSDEQEDTNANDANLKMSKDAKDVMEAVKKVHVKAHSLSKSSAQWSLFQRMTADVSSG